MAVAGSMTEIASPDSPDVVVRVPTEALERPRRAPEVELVGQMQDSAFEEPQWLICYDGSQYIQSTPLLYHVLSFADGTRSVDEIAEQVSSAIGTEITGEQVAWLVENRLAISGLLDLSLPGSKSEDWDEDEADVAEEQMPVVRPAEMPILGIRYRVPLLPYEWTAPITNLFQHLYHPPVMVVMVLMALAINAWIYTRTDLWGSIQTVLYQPELMLVLFGIDVLSTLFHEFGHAAALRRARCRYGWMGFAIYFIFPVFYTDVTHIYRLKRAERIRVDLGGMYFQLIFMIVLFGAYLGTNNGVFVLAIIMTTFGFLRQFTPWLRFDGYYTVADIMGVNEPLSLVGPFIRDHLPWRRDSERRLPPMKLSSKIAFITYLIAVFGFFFYPFAIGAFAGRQFVQGLVDSGTVFWNQFITAWGGGDVLAGIVATIQFAFWLLIPLGLSLFAYTLTRHFGKLGIKLYRGLRNRWWPQVSVDGVSDPEYRNDGTIDREESAMATYDSMGNKTEINSNGSRGHDHPHEIQQAIERIGAQYIASLRDLSAEISRVYTEQLDAKDERIASLEQRVEAAEHERDLLQVQINRIEQLGTQYVDNLRSIRSEVTWDDDRAERNSETQGMPGGVA